MIVTELFLFVDPVHHDSFLAVERVHELQRLLPQSIKVHMALSFTPRSVYEQLKYQQSHDNKLAHYNTQMILSSYISRVYYALSLQGNRFAREFFLALQGLNEWNQSHIYDLAFSFCKDKEMFMDDYHNLEFIRKIYIKDQALMREWGIKQIPAAVVFSKDHEGIIVTSGWQSKDLLTEACCLRSAPSII